jgi:hypothetical protein
MLAPAGQWILMKMGIHRFFHRCGGKLDAAATSSSHTVGFDGVAPIRSLPVRNEFSLRS